MKINNHSRCLLLVATLLFNSLLGQLHADSISFGIHIGSNPPPPPPPPKVEVVNVPPPPSPDHVWVAGYWSFSPSEGGWVWKPGHYEHKPFPWAKWIPAHQQQWGNEYFWVHGHFDY